MFNKTQGTFQNLAGHVQEAFGAATGDAASEIKGKARRAAGSAQQGYGEILNQVRESAVTNPIGTVAVVAGVAFILGAAWAKR